ncbi:uncharacterized protein LOC135216459 [Macrobrachium nipponense]|uniref:uncharacterized protein LOC135216459 n=1 Tax=Macrobrachium nipponense TaxID=159736 RepID=UPI0030C7DA05
MAACDWVQTTGEKFCRNFASVAATLHSLTSPKKKYEWDERCQAAFEHSKYFLSSEPVLHSPNFSKPFSLQVDACDKGAGGVLLQEIDGVLPPNGYTSSSFKPHQLSYSTIEELLSLVLALQKFECYLIIHPTIIQHAELQPSGLEFPQLRVCRGGNSKYNLNDPAFDGNSKATAIDSVFRGRVICHEGTFTSLEGLEPYVVTLGHGSPGVAFFNTGTCRTAVLDHYTTYCIPVG